MPNDVEALDAHGRAARPVPRLCLSFALDNDLFDRDFHAEAARYRYHLKQLGREHIIFEAADVPAHVWRDDRWDSFTFVTRNWTIQLPGAVYEGYDPDGFLKKAEILAYFEGYVEKYKFPIQLNTTVTEVTPVEGGYQVTANERPTTLKI